MPGIRAIGIGMVVPGTAFAGSVRKRVKDRRVPKTNPEAFSAEE